MPGSRQPLSAIVERQIEVLVIQSQRFGPEFPLNTGMILMRCLETQEGAAVGGNGEPRRDQNGFSVTDALSLTLWLGGVFMISAN